MKKFRAFETIGRQFMLECEADTELRFFRNNETVAVYADCSQGQLIAYAVVKHGVYMKPFGVWEYVLAHHSTGSRFSAPSYNLRHLSAEEIRLLWSVRRTKAPVPTALTYPAPELCVIDGGAA
jgi:hypothetical protein